MTAAARRDRALRLSACPLRALVATPTIRAKGGITMCNPRRVMINLTCTIEQSWRTLIEQTARVEGQVQELARISADIPLDAEMGDLALQMLERVLHGEFEGFAAWERDNEGN